jgi:hypothetical protein
MSSTMSRRQLLAMAGALALAARPAWSDTRLAALYQARTIVTGQRPETRIPGLKACLGQVLVRVSGDPRLETHPRLAALAEQPERAVSHLSYRDLYAFRPIRDEQGTRDRPYEITVEYDPARIDAMLAELGSRPWLADRPRLVVFLAVRHIASSFVLTSTIDAGDLMREAFADAAWRYAMEVVIPSQDMLSRNGLTVEDLTNRPLPSLAGLVDRSVGQTPVLGQLTWAKELLGWRAEWRIAKDGAEHRWGIAGVNFDAAFRNAVGGAAQILSGNGDPA